MIENLSASWTFGQSLNVTRGENLETSRELEVAGQKTQNCMPSVDSSNSTLTPVEFARRCYGVTWDAVPKQSWSIKLPAIKLERPFFA